MKKAVYFLMLIIISLALLSSCGELSSDNSADGNSNQTDNKSTKELQATTFQAEVIEAGDYLLITPDKDSNEYRSSDKISVAINNAVITDLDGEKIMIQDLKAGDLLQITYNGVILESYPAQITASAIEVTGHNILMEGYLALIDDIYQEDSALNDKIEMIALDTSGWIELSDIEKGIIFAKMKEIYGVDIIEGTSNELVEQGIIDKGNLYFPHGVHIIISNMKYDENKAKIACSIEKWRSGDGAIGSNKVTAKFKDGEWKITKEDRWIS